MKYSSAVLACLAASASAFPFVANDVSKPKQKRQVTGTAAALALSKGRTNCGNIPCAVFLGESQHVETTGDHAYYAPRPDEIRGPCPGLNAAANHGYLSRSGITTITESIEGLAAAFGMGPGLSGFLAAYAVLFTGDPLLQTWSIGGPPPSDALTKALLGQPQGISWSHNTYEGDVSIGRFDAYTNNGDAHSLDLERFRQAYATAVNDRYTLDGFAQDFTRKGQQSIENNPMFFSAPFSGILVAPAAYFFVINMMSNHSAEEPNGYLNGAMFKEFFAVEGHYPFFTWKKGQERIPDNWYRRPLITPYDIPNADSDLAVQYAAYPDSFHLGGNTGGINTYTGVDLGDLTGGVLNAEYLFDIENPMASCFYAQLVQSLIPDPANLLAAEVSAITSLVNDLIKPIINLDCPTVDKFDQTLFNVYPGHKYKPQGPGNTS